LRGAQRTLCYIGIVKHLKSRVVQSIVEMGQYRCGALNSVAYVGDWISKLEEDALTQSLLSSRRKWVAVNGRLVQAHGGLVTLKGLVAAPFETSQLAALAARVSREAAAAFGGGQANHVLVNRYLPHQGIMPHEDGPSYAPAAAILSLGAPAVLRFLAKSGTDGPARRPVASVALMPRSLVVFWGEAYTAHLHGIDAPPDGVETIDSSVLNADACGLTVGSRLPRGGARLSLTVRRVPRVLRSLALGGVRPEN
jgi:alkylated DNA repair protein alkB homolog 6